MESAHRSLEIDAPGRVAAPRSQRILAPLRRAVAPLVASVVVLLCGAGDSAQAEGSASAAAVAKEASATLEGEVGVIEVRVRDVRKEKGVVVIQLAVSKEDYDEGLGIFELARAPIKGGEAIWRFEEIPYGVYALRIFHDANSNDKLDANFMGIPKETFAFSNNAMGRFGPASWEDARFSVDAPVVRQDLALKKVGP